MSVAHMLRRHGHEVFTAGEARLARASDDEITVWADRLGGVVVTMDREFSRRRRRSVIGWHVWLRCPDPDAAWVLQLHLDEVISLVASNQHVLVRVSQDDVRDYYRWT
jgi:predicted nuclease of predicted toxin-antitoxin system